MNTKKLYYEAPGKHWVEALPLGNGSIGAMCYSGVGTDIISLNHDTLWTGHPRKVSREGAYDAYRRAQKLALEGEYKKADEELECNFTSLWSQAYMPFGDLKLHFQQEEFENYQRSLDLSEAILTSAHSSGGVSFRKTAFVSFPHDIFVYKIESGNKRPFSFALELSCPLRSTVYTKNGLLIVDGECPGDADTAHPAYPCNSLLYSGKGEERGVQFRGAAAVESDGEILENQTSLEVKNATCAVIRLTIQTSYNGFDKSPFLEGREYKNRCLEILKRACELSFDQLKARHIADYRAYYDRVSLDLDTESAVLTPTDRRLKEFEADKQGNDLYVLLFHYGRYLLISSSRAGSLATNLQGIWSDSVKPPWNCNYTVNINTQMNYWPVLPCNMPELMEPMVELVKALSVTGEETAKCFYHADGFVVHHNADIWGHSVPVQGSPKWACWQGGSGWLCRSLFELYEYTLDRDYLEKTAFPIMKKAALFYLDTLVEDEYGFFIISPATSPENAFHTPQGPSGTSRSTAMMNSIVLDLFLNCQKSCHVLGIRDAFYDAICSSIPKIKPLAIGENGEVLEWNEQLPETEPHHRHVSHLYALHPAGLITKGKTRELFEACQKTLQLRGDDGTGWSLAWKVNFWARLLDGNHALKLIDRLLTLVEPGVEGYQAGGVYPNLFDAHPPFQIDGNFGVLSGICEMLVQSDGKNIYLLPALPDKWGSGCVKGLAVRGNITVDIRWKNGRITQYDLHGDAEGANVVLCR